MSAAVSQARAQRRKAAHWRRWDSPAQRAPDAGAVADGPAGGTPVSAANLQNMEDGIEAIEAQSVGGWVDKVVGDTGTSVVAFDKIFVDTTGGTFNLVLPSTHTDGEMVKFVDVAGNFATDNFTINVASGDKFMGVVDDFLLLTVDNDYVDVTYSGASYGWVITSKP